MSRPLTPHAAPDGVVANDIRGKATEIHVALGSTGDPNVLALYDVASGGKYGHGCLLKNLDGRRNKCLWLYSPLKAADGTDAGSGVRWIAIS